MAKAITAWIVGYVELHEIITYVAYSFIKIMWLYIYSYKYTVTVKKNKKANITWQRIK